MNQKEYNRLVNLIQEMKQEILSKKSSDYASEKDVLSNFKRVSGAAKALEINIHYPTGYALFMVLMKMDRLNNLIVQGKKPQNETLIDTIVDLENYAELAYACHEESSRNYLL